MARKTRKPMTDNPVINRMMELLKAQGKQEQELAEYLDISKSTISKWKFYGDNTYLRHIDQICKYLDTTPNYLFGEYKDDGLYLSPTERLSYTEKQLIRTYRGISKEKQKLVREVLKQLAS